QREKPIAGGQRLRDLGQGTVGQSIDDDARAARQRGQPRTGSLPYRPARARKTFAEVEHARAPAERGKFCDDATIITVAAGRRVDVAGNREHDLLHHSGASYQARADGDSATVTRIAASSR